MTVPGIVRRAGAARLEDSAPSWAASGRETALRARGSRVCSMAWGAGRCATGGTRRGDQSAPPAVFRWVHAGSWALGAAPAPACFWGLTLRETRICAGDCSRSAIRQRHKKRRGKFGPSILPPTLNFLRLCTAARFVPPGTKCVQAGVVCGSEQLSGDQFCILLQLRALSLRGRCRMNF